MLFLSGETYTKPMDNMLDTPPKSPTQSDKSVPDCKTPPPVKQADENSLPCLNSGNDLRKAVTPDRLKVPKAFKYPERYAKKSFELYDLYVTVSKTTNCIHVFSLIL